MSCRCHSETRHPPLHQQVPVYWQKCQKKRPSAVQCSRNYLPNLGLPRHQEAFAAEQGCLLAQPLAKVYGQTRVAHLGLLRPLSQPIHQPQLRFSTSPTHRNYHTLAQAIQIQNPSGNRAGSKSWYGTFEGYRN